MRLTSTCLFGCALALVATELGANDGFDRYRKQVPHTLQLFPLPASPDAGYCMLERDMEGGADGDIRHRWAQPHAVALVQLCARAVARDLGAGPHPMVIMDASSENGDTPVELGATPRGRHPGGSHDGGLNLDLGYYLTSLKGQVHTPDFAACTNHYRLQDGQPRDTYQCLESADRLDVPRTARFFVELFALNRDLFGGDLLEQIGVDFQVRKAVLEQARIWGQGGRHGVDATLLEDMNRVLTSDEADGWARTHHHHLHLRLRDIPLYGAHRKALDHLLSEGRHEEGLQRKVGDAAPTLAAVLLSVDLQRSLEVELLPSPLEAEDLQFRVDDGPWRKAQPGDPRNRAVLDLAPPFKAQARVEARGTLNGKPIALSRILDLPAQSPRLGIAIEATQLKARIQEDGASLSITLNVPQAYGAWVTEYALVLHRPGQKPERRVMPTQGRLKLPKVGIVKVELEALCSSRRAIRVPVWLDGRI